MTSTYIIDQKKWASLDIFNQMGNIYSEVGRSFKTMHEQDTTDHTEAIGRAIDLFDATIDALNTRKSPKLKEVLRAKEQFLNTITDKHATRESIRGLDQYFMEFAVAARLRR